MLQEMLQFEKGLVGDFNKGRGFVPAPGCYQRINVALGAWATNSPSPFDNPAAISFPDLGRWLCVLIFRIVCHLQTSDWVPHLYLTMPLDYKQKPNRYVNITLYLFILSS